jgi:hypothetical protein
VLKGIKAEYSSGFSVSAAGDVNGDGLADVIIGTAGAAPPYGGESYVVFGRTTDFPPVFQLGSLFPAGGGDGSTGFVLRGAGWSVSDAGDVNDDGTDDLIVGAPYSGHTDPGKTYVVFGRVDAPVAHTQ